MTKYLGFLFLPASLLAAEVEYEGKISVSEFDAKYVRHSWCILSDGDSSTRAGEISTALKGSSQSHSEEFTYRGVNYLKRKIEWDSRENENSFELTFAADSAAFSGKQEFDKKTCSYRAWAGKSSSAESNLRARAAFLVPRNVWAIRIRSIENSELGVTKLQLFNKEYITSPEGDAKLQKLPFYQFDGQQAGKYFLVNASSEDHENFIYLDVDYSSKVLAANQMKLKFEVDFIAASECLSDLKGLSYIDLINRNVLKNAFENAFVNMACMLNPHYIKHSLSTMHLSSLNDFFKKLNDLEVKLTKTLSSTSLAFDLENMNALLSLINRVRFYYSYEILKETMNLLLQKVDYNGEEIDTLFYMDILRKKGVLYLFDVFNDLSSSLRQALERQEGPFITLAEDDAVKFDIFLNSLLPMEFNSFQQAHELIYRPEYLSRQYFQELDTSIQNVLARSRRVFELGRELLKEKYITDSQALLLDENIRTLTNELRHYIYSFESLRLHAGSDDEARSLIEARKKLLNQIEEIFHLNLSLLMEEVNAYYRKHFEDPAFKLIKVGDRKYSDVGDFIDDFQQLLAEIKK